MRRAQRGLSRQIFVFVAVSALAVGFVLPVASPPTRADAPFTGNVRVNTDGGLAAQKVPWLAVDGAGRVSIAWQDHRNGDYDVYFARSTDKGRTWTDPNVRINTDVGEAAQMDPVLVANATGDLFAAWQDYREDPWNATIYFAGSTDGGASWTDPNVRVVDLGMRGVQRDPSLAADASGTVYAVWHQVNETAGDIYFAKSTDGGSAWTHPNVKVNPDNVTAVEALPVIAVGPGGVLYVVWGDGRTNQGDLYLAKSVDGGATWTTPPGRIESDPSHPGQYEPTIAVDRTGNVSVAWGDYRNGNWDVYFAASTDGGNSWTRPNIMVNPPRPAGQFEPAIALGPDGRLFAAFADERNQPGRPYADIYFTRSTDGGATWAAPDLRVNDDLGASWQGEATIGWDPAGTVYVAWEDARSGIGYPDIYVASLAVPALVAVNHPPVITNLASAPTEARPEVPVLFTFHATDPDGDPLSWRLTSGPRWLAIGPANGTIYGAPSVGATGFDTVSIEVSDGRGGTDDGSFPLTVQPPATDAGPIAPPFDFLPAASAAVSVAAVFAVLLAALVWRRRRRAPIR